MAKKSKDNVPSPKPLLLKELSEEQYNKLMEDLDLFDNMFFEHLAGTPKFEVCPTSDQESGLYMTDRDYSMLKSECSKYGLNVLYSIDIGRDVNVIINPLNIKKIGIIKIGGEIH